MWGRATRARGARPSADEERRNGCTRTADVDAPVRGAASAGPLSCRQRCRAHAAPGAPLALDRMPVPVAGDRAEHRPGACAAVDAGSMPAPSTSPGGVALPFPESACSLRPAASPPSLRCHARSSTRCITTAPDGGVRGAAIAVTLFPSSIRYKLRDTASWQLPSAAASPVPSAPGARRGSCVGVPPGPSRCPSA
jgi:hypothetical protein